MTRNVSHAVPNRTPLSASFVSHCHGSSSDRDIKPENLLFDEHGTLKLADFGLSINTEVERPMTRVGTLDYISPEVIVRPDPEEEGYQAGGYDGACDAWATGVLCYECLCGSAPFDRGRKQATVEAILKCEFELPSFLSEDARTFILAALARDPNKRPTIEELSQFRWIQKHTRLTRGSFSAATSTAVASAPLGVSPAASASASSLMGRSPHQLLAHAFPHQRSPAVNALLGNRRGSLRPFGPGAPPADYRSAPSTVSSSPAIPIVHGALANGSLSKGPASYVSFHLERFFSHGSVLRVSRTQNKNPCLLQYVFSSP